MAFRNMLVVFVGNTRMRDDWKYDYVYLTIMYEINGSDTRKYAYLQAPYNSSPTLGTIYSPVNTAFTGFFRSCCLM